MADYAAALRAVSAALEPAGNEEAGGVFGDERKPFLDGGFKHFYFSPPTWGNDPI